MAPFLFIIFFDLEVIGRTYYSAPNDNTAGFFALGLNWYTLTPLAFFHHPCPSFHALSGLIISLIGLPDDKVITGYLSLFNDIGIIFHIITLSVTAFWIGNLAVRLNLSSAAIFICAVLTSTMPTMILFSTLWGDYYILGLLFIAVSFGLMLANKTGNWFNKSTFITFIILGFCIGNYYPTIILFFVSLVSFTNLKAISSDSAVLSHRDHRFTRLIEGLLTFLTLYLLVYNIMQFSGLLGMTHLIPFSLITTLLIIGSIYFLAKLNPVISACFLGLGFPLLLGWTIGANYFAFMGTWGTNAISAIKFKGGASPQLTFHEIMARVDLLTFLGNNWWNWAIVIFLSVGLIGLIYYLWTFSTKKRTNISFFPYLFICLMIVITIIVIADVSLLGRSFSMFDFGQTSRYHLIIISVIPIILLTTDQLRFLPRLLLFSLFLGIGLLSFGQYWWSLAPITVESAASE